MKKNRYFVRMIRVMAMMLALFTGAGGAWCVPAGMLTAYAKGMEKPTLNAAVSDGVLSIQAQSGDSVIQKIMVNGYEFDDVWNGTLNIRLQQFDASYPEFSIQAADQDGNWSETYKVVNLLWSSFFVTLVAKKIVLINLCCRPCFIWGSITIITVWTNMIIINVCKFFYLLIECFLCCKLIQICAFILQGIEVTLHRCIVVRISCFAHALCHIYRFAEFGKCFGRIL